MKKAKQLMSECMSRRLNCSITFQRMNDYSVEIYTGYKETYKKVFYTDGHTQPKKAIRKALKFLSERD